MFLLEFGEVLVEGEVEFGGVEVLDFVHFFAEVGVLFVLALDVDLLVHGWGEWGG